MDLPALAERVWYGRGAGPAFARAALAPAELLFRGIAAARGALFDAGALAMHPLALPALSVGNLTVGGTGKTPVAAWLAARLVAAGARPALVLRGVGDDEPRVHALLNPTVPVVTNPDRVAGAAEAARLGCDVVVLDDAFQHRRAARTADLVLVSAERFAERAVRLLPAGPYREGLGALRRASGVLVTRKSASLAVADACVARLTREAPGVPAAVCHLAPDRLRRWAPEEETEDAPVTLDLAALAGATVLAVSGIGEPAAFEAQLAASGVRVDPARFGDHHAYDAEEVACLAARAARVGHVVTTLKDAVKLGPRWPRGGVPLWYVSQRVEVERGAAVLDGLLRTVLAACRS
jgi:tetraacyldisaccharide 4'-kinase